MWAMSRAAPPETDRRASPLPPDERRAAIVRAVLPLVVERGTAATSRQLAAAAGVSEGTIFNVFADKGELLAAVLEAALDTEPLEAAIEAIDDEDDFEEQLLAATEVLRRRTNDIVQIVSHLVHSGHAARSHGPTRAIPDSPALAALFGREPERIRVAPEVAARRLRAITHALGHPMFSDPPASAREIVEVFLHGHATTAAPAAPGRASAVSR
jgi:AcrR family transcriptional regulator